MHVHYLESRVGPQEVEDVPYMHDATAHDALVVDYKAYPYLAYA